MNMRRASFFPTEPLKRDNIRRSRSLEGRSLCFVALSCPLSRPPRRVCTVTAELWSSRECLLVVLAAGRGRAPRSSTHSSLVHTALHCTCTHDRTAHNIPSSDRQSYHCHSNECGTHIPSANFGIARFTTFGHCYRNSGVCAHNNYAPNSENMTCSKLLYIPGSCKRRKAASSERSDVAGKLGGL